MSSDLKYVQYICDQLSGIIPISFKKMFGEYTLYSQNKVVALICDNQLFVKPTQGGRSFIGSVSEQPPYPGAKPSFLIDERVDDQDWASHLIKITADELPQPKSKPTPKKKIK